MDRSRQRERLQEHRHDGAPRRARPDDHAVLALQRAAGNQAVAQLLGRGGRPPGIQRLVVRLDDPSDLKKRDTADFVKSAEVDRMAEYLSATHGGNAISFNGSNKLEITAGEHWFAGHGSGADFANVSVPAFVAKLSFAQLQEGQQATLHLISCNLGNIREPTVFAKDLRRTLQADPALTGRTIVVEAAPAFVVHTAGVQASFTAKNTPVDDLHGVLEEREEAIDTEEAMRLWTGLSALLRDEQALPKPPTKKSLGQYLAGMSDDAAKAAAGAVARIRGDDPEYRPKVVAALEEFARAEPQTLLRSARKLGELIDAPSGVNTASSLVVAARERLRDRAKELWLAFEHDVAALGAHAAPSTLTADDPQRGEIKQRLKAKDPAAVREYGWIQYSTKGRFKPSEG